MKRLLPHRKLLVLIIDMFSSRSRKEKRLIKKLNKLLDKVNVREKVVKISEDKFYWGQI